MKGSFRVNQNHNLCCSTDECWCWKISCGFLKDNIGKLSTLK